jgi:hypothetical protein
MSYADEAALAQDQQFQARLTSALVEEAKPKADDYVAQTVLRAPTTGLTMFMPFISTAPGFGVAYGEGGQIAITDGMILSAVQGSWSAVSALNPGPTPVVP